MSAYLNANKDYKTEGTPIRFEDITFPERLNDVEGELINFIREMVWSEMKWEVTERVMCNVSNKILYATYTGRPNNAINPTHEFFIINGGQVYLLTSNERIIVKCSVNDMSSKTVGLIDIINLAINNSIR